MNTFQKEKLCLNDIESVVIRQLGSYWQELSRQNDLGTDGMIFLAKKKHQTGKMLYVQAKYGDSYMYTEDEKSVTLRFSSHKLTGWREYWNSKNEPVILVYQDSNQRILWVDAKEASVFTNTTVCLPKKQILNAKSKSSLVKMFGRKNPFSKLEEIKCLPKTRPNYYQRGDLKINSKKLYDEFKTAGSINYKNAYFTDLKFSRLGWNHITSPKRGTQRITSSLENIGLVRLILENVGSYFILKTEAHGDSKRIDKIGIKARITFDRRPTGIFQIIVLSRKTFNSEGDYTDDKWFLSIHEVKED